MRGSLHASRRDVDDRVGEGAPRRAGRRNSAVRWALAAVVGCVVLFAAAPGAMAATGTVEGKVTEAAGSHKALEGVSVTVYDLDEVVVGSGFTNAAGEYTISVTSGEEYKIEFSKEPQYVAQYYNKALSFESATPFLVEGSPTKINAELQEPGAISGRVTNSAGTPVANVEVQAYGSNSEFESVRLAFTNTNGEYTLEGLPEGEYKVGFFPNQGGYRTQFYNGQLSFETATPVHVTAGQATTGIGAALTEGAKISGRVTDASTHAGLAKIRVNAFSANPEVEVDDGGSAETNINGEYTISGLSTGAYKVEFSWEFSLAEYKACEQAHLPKCIPKYITQYFNNQPSAATATPVGATENTLTPGVNAAMVASVPVNTALPLVSGTLTVGSVLSCSNGSWTGEPELTLAVGWPLTSPFTYQWLRDGLPIAGDTSTSYLVQAADVGHALACEVMATNDAGHASARSNPVVVALPVVTVSSSKIAVSGGSARVPIACANATCKGTIEISGQVKGKGKKKKTVTLVKGSYSLAAGKKATVSVRLTAAGKSALAAAKRHRLSGKATVTVTSGTTLRKSVVLSESSKGKHK